MAVTYLLTSAQNDASVSLFPRDDRSPGDHHSICSEADMHVFFPDANSIKNCGKLAFMDQLVELGISLQTY